MLDFFRKRCQDVDMNCPFCGSSQVAVVNSRPTFGATQIWRRRKCFECQEAFTSYEKIDLSHIVVIKKSGRRQRFNRAKLFSGIYRAFLDRKNIDKGQAAELAEEVTTQVEKEIVALGGKRILSTEITELVLRILKKKAPDTLLRFLAYREGGDVAQLKRLLKKYL